jgi:MFS transporter, DHA2 family, multidrug resistance protein
VLSILVGIGLGAVFVRRQTTLADPMLDLTPSRNRAFSIGLATNISTVFASFGSFILVSQYLQLVLGLSPLRAGLLSLPASLLAISGPMLSPLLSRRIGLRGGLAALLTIAAAGFALQALVGGPFAIVMVATGWALWAFGGSAARRGHLAADGARRPGVLRSTASDCERAARVSAPGRV